MAWKTINSVICLTKQERMKSDPDFGDAVGRLRIRECTEDDVNIFNSLIIRSAMNEQGVDMGSPEEKNAVSIVDTNAIREILNIRKAHSICTESGHTLIMSAAIDKCSSTSLSNAERHQLLNMDFSSSKLNQNLPGFIPLFINMPIILRNKNLSTDLGITNGAQGILRKFYTAIAKPDLTYCTCAIVHFPTSRVQLSGLEKGEYPIFPITTTFSTRLLNADLCKTIRISRSQLPFQPGFAVTGHSAEGKTLPKVVAGLHKGGFGAYVAASRAKCRHHLRITHPVTVHDLNKPLPFQLVQDNDRLEAIQHNTMVKHSFISGAHKSIPDPESEMKIRDQTFSVKTPPVSESAHN